MGTGETLPSYIDMVRGIATAYGEFTDFEKYPTDYDYILRSAFNLSAADFLSIVFITSAISIARYLLTHKVYVGLENSVSARSMQKFCESAFKFKAYLLLWSYGLWVIILSGKYDFFQNPCKTLDYSNLANEEMPGDIRVMYLLQISFYLHCFYGTIFLDVWRKDSMTMLLHHFLTLCLLYFSFVMKYYKIGALVLILHDVSDVCLEITKLCVYLKKIYSPWQKLLEVCSSIGFVAFAGSWAVCRLYWFPLKVVHAGSYGNWYYNTNGNYPRLWCWLNIMLLTLQVLHIYWFCFIVQLLVRILTGKTRTLHDTREYDSPPRTSNGKGIPKAAAEAGMDAGAERETAPVTPPSSRTGDLRQRRPSPGGDM